jgi:hypothetical protein
VIIDSHTVVFGLFAILVVLLIGRTLSRWNAAPDNDFELRDLFMENGRASKGAVVLMGAFAATTWFFMYYTLTGRMTEGYFGLYAGAWIAPVVARMITSAPTEAKAVARS